MSSEPTVWYHSLYFKLSLVLLSLLLLVGSASLWTTLRSSNLYFCEMQQNLNRDVAASIDKFHPLFTADGVDQDGLKSLFMHAMGVNPALEVYLLDAEGQILGYDAPPEKIVRDRVDLGPVHEFIDSEPGDTILGDDPRHPERQKVFSAKPIADDSGLRGYVYAILASEVYDSVASMLQASHILRTSSGILLACSLAALVAGLIAFGWLTRPLRGLRTAVSQFQEDNLTVRAEDLPRGEIGDLGHEFNAMADRILKQMHQIKQIDRSRREMVASISHDLRTPLASLQGYLETLLRKAGTLDEETRNEYLATALRSSARLGRLVDDLFQLAKLDAGDLRLNVENFSLAELVSDTVQKFRLRAEEFGISLEMRLPDAAPIVRGDLGLIERALDNLLDNALRHTKAGGSVAVSLVPQGKQVEVRVTDTGCGIPKGDLPRIFDRFYRVDKSRGEDSGGTGLGLAITKRILELHGSKIRVRSAENVGTAFAFRLAA